MNIKLLLTLAVLLALTTSMMVRPHEATFAWYDFDETKTGGNCKDVLQCDGLRVCTAGKCTGLARPPKVANYRYNEKITMSACP